MLKPLLLPAILVVLGIPVAAAAGQQASTASGALARTDTRQEAASDEGIAEESAEPSATTRALEGGATYGNVTSFPSGHAAATFATAMVLQDHYGWKVGVPFFAASTYTAVSRLTINKHWASDVTFGAFVGIASARTVTLHGRNSKFALVPLAVPGGGGVAAVRVSENHE